MILCGEVPLLRPICGKIGKTPLSKRSMTDGVSKFQIHFMFSMWQLMHNVTTSKIESRVLYPLITLKIERCALSLKRISKKGSLCLVNLRSFQMKTAVYWSRLKDSLEVMQYWRRSFFILSWTGLSRSRHRRLLLHLKRTTWKRTSRTFQH